MVLTEELKNTATAVESAIFVLDDLADLQDKVKTKYQRQIEDRIDREKPEGYTAAPVVLVARSEKPLVREYGLLHDWAESGSRWHSVKGGGLWLEENVALSILSLRLNQFVLTNTSFPSQVEELLRDVQEVSWQKAAALYYRQTLGQAPQAKETSFEVVVGTETIQPGNYTISTITVEGVRTVGDPEYVGSLFSPTYWIYKTGLGKEKATKLKHRLTIPSSATPFDQNLWGYIKTFEPEIAKEMVLGGYGERSFKENKPWSVPLGLIPFNIPVISEGYRHVKMWCSTFTLEDLPAELAKLEILTNPLSQGLFFEGMKMYKEPAVQDVVEKRKLYKIVPFTEINLTYALAGKALLETSESSP